MEEIEFHRNKLDYRKLHSLFGEGETLLWADLCVCRCVGGGDQ